MLTNHEAMSTAEQQIGLIVSQFTPCTVQEANNAGVAFGLRQKGGIVEGRIDMVGLEIEIVESGLRRIDGVGSDGEVARLINFLIARLTFDRIWYGKNSKWENELGQAVEEMHGEDIDSGIFFGGDAGFKSLRSSEHYGY